MSFKIPSNPNYDPNFIKHQGRSRIKKLFCILMLLQYVSSFFQALAFNCSAPDECYQNNGKWQEDFGQCICAYGWKGSACEYCSGKVRLTDESGIIHDGWGNYSESNKCNWLIDTRNSNWLKKQNQPPTIRMHLREFATECGWDHLYIYDGDSVDSPLLAVFSGLMYRGNFSIRRVPQVIARSGTALLHFFSDDAYNMSGFNLSYRMNACPSDNEEIECSGHGKCKDGFCVCDPLYSGEACNIAACPNNCMEDRNHGVCNLEEERCICKEGYGGNDCGQLKAHGVWSSVNTKQSLPPPGTASHAAAVWRDTMYIIAGESYGRGKLMTTYDFNGNVWETVHTEKGSTVPEHRYGMSTVMYGDKIFMYGGVVKGTGITNELWAFDVSAKTWENITVNAEPCNTLSTPYAMCGPLHVTGHTATLVPGFGDKHSYRYMVVIFGRSPQYGYLNTVQEFNFGTREWKIVETTGYVVKGGFSHSAAYDYLTEKIYVYGGIVSESEASQYITTSLYAYSPSTRTWTLLSSAPSARLLHTANFINQGLMMVFGGNTHNDTAESYGAKCYSQDLLVYDVFCDSWHKQNIPMHLQADLARFGHSAVVFEDDLYIYGGFNGQLLNDMLRFSSGICSFYTKEEKCTNARPGVKCIWDVQKMRCIPITKVQRSAIYGREQYDYIACPSKSRLTKTSELLLDVSRCQELTNCQSCVSNSYGCTYCGNGVCTKERCRETSPLTSVFYETSTQQQSQHSKAQFVIATNAPPLNIKQLENCPANEDVRIAAICEQLHTCHACAANTACMWEPEHNRCRSYVSANGNRTVDEIICPPSCASLSNCHNCTENDCIWCQNELRCIDRNSYTASFPYGQCRDWTTYTSKCDTSHHNSSKSQCDNYNSCSECLDDPACGWCDDGSNTGIGKCTEGGASNVKDLSECPSNQWYFITCPLCNCNGHSKCYHNSQQCEKPCSDFTYGSYCEKCISGYWGNPHNGGQCQNCKCNGNGDSCHPETGKCYCNTKGTIGNHCEKCDTRNNYRVDPTNSYCYYELITNYRYTFNISRPDELHYKEIHFHNSPIKTDTDVDFVITCNGSAKLYIELQQLFATTEQLFADINCSNFTQRFSHDKNKYDDLMETNRTLTTFHVSLRDLKPPILIQISFAQYPKLNILQSLFGII
ncbi:attractin-like protein 1 isoform 1-T2 [Cochliomyia hominivorax]